MTWCCQPKVGPLIHLLSIGRCQSLSATPSPVLRLWLPVLKASFDVVQPCNLGSGCCEKSTGKPCWRPPWFCLAVACLSFGSYLPELCCLCWAIYLAGPDLDPVTWLPALNPDLLHWYGLGWQLLKCARPWLLLLAGSAFLAQVLCGLYPMSARTLLVPTLSCSAPGWHSSPAAPWH